MTIKHTKVSAEELLELVFADPSALSDEVRAHLQAAAQTVADKFAAIPARDARLKVARPLMRALHQNRNAEAVVAVAEAVPELVVPGNPHFNWHLMALEQTGRIDTLREVLSKHSLSAIGKGSPGLLNMQRRHRIPVSTGEQEKLFGPARATLDDMLRHLPTEPWRSEQSDRLADRLFDAAPRDMDREAFRQRLAWGMGAQRLLSFVSLRQMYPEFHSEFLALGPTPDISPLRDAALAGRSVLIARAHAGINAHSRRAYMIDDLPSLTIFRNAPPAEDDGESPAGSEVWLGTKGDTHTGFAAMIKMVRKAPHQMSLYPDGPDGVDRQSFEFLGHEVSLGLGASSLAWHGKAATFFACMFWDGFRLVPHLAVGPVADRAGEREAFDAAFHAFYLDQLRSIALGAPENIGSLGGIWQTIINS